MRHRVSIGLATALALLLLTGLARPRRGQRAAGGGRRPRQAGAPRAALRQPEIRQGERAQRTEHRPGDRLGVLARRPSRRDHRRIRRIGGACATAKGPTAGCFTACSARAAPRWSTPWAKGDERVPLYNSDSTDSPRRGRSSKSGVLGNVHVLRRRVVPHLGRRLFRLCAAGQAVGRLNGEEVK